MHSQQYTLEREIPAIQIPSGAPLTLPAQSRVLVTQTLGGSVTVMTDYGMARISPEHVDALGEEFANLASAAPKPSSSVPTDGTPDEESIWAQLRNVYDPEIPVNIVDLGLVYSLEVRELDDGSHKAEVQMTLTAPGCGMGPAIAEDAKTKMLLVPGLDDAEVQLVWDPPWHQDMITEEGKMKLGLI